MSINSVDRFEHRIIDNKYILSFIIIINLDLYCMKIIKGYFIKKIIKYEFFEN